MKINKEKLEELKKMCIDLFERFDKDEVLFDMMYCNHCLGGKGYTKGILKSGSWVPQLFIPTVPSDWRSDLDWWADFLFSENWGMGRREGKNQLLDCIGRLDFILENY